MTRSDDPNHMKRKSAPMVIMMALVVPFLIIVGVIGASLELKAQEHEKSNIFTLYDFDILRNYLLVKGNVNISKDGCIEAKGKLAQWHVQLEYLTNCSGWGTIHVCADSSQVNYFLNHEEVEFQGNPKVVTILTSSRGDATNPKSVDHFLWLLENIKLDLLQIEYAELLFSELERLTKSGESELEGTTANYNFFLERKSPKKRTITIVPKPSLPLLPYRLRFKLKTRRVKVEWQYLTNETSDDYFFKHFSEEVLLLTHRSEKLKDHLASQLKTNGSKKALLQAAMLENIRKGVDQ